MKKNTRIELEKVRGILIMIAMKLEVLRREEGLSRSDRDTLEEAKEAVDACLNALDSADTESAKEKLTKMADRCLSFLGKHGVLKEIVAVLSGRMLGE